MNANTKEKTARSAGSLLRSYTPILYLVIFVTVAGLLSRISRPRRTF